MRGVFLILILVTLPLLGAIGHDIYLNYQEQQQNYQNYEFTTVGFLWIKYDSESFKTTRDILEENDWKILSAWILNQKTVVVTGAFTGFIYIIGFLMWLLKIGPYKTRSINFNRARNKKTDEILGQAEKTPYKYKRK